MGRQARLKRERRLGPKVGRPISRIELARAARATAQAAEEAKAARIRAAIVRHMPAGVLGRVAAVTALVSTAAFREAQSTAFSQADLGLRPPKNEEDVRALILGVLHGEAFKADTRDVLLKIFFDKRAERLTVSIGPGVEAARVAVEAAQAELAAAVPPPVSEVAPL